MQAVRTKYAPVAPLTLLQEMIHQRIVGDYHLLLAHEILNNPTSWKEWGCELREFLWPQSPVIIMDSSVIELGKPLPMLDIMEATRIVGANVVVLPDVIGDALATINLVQAFEEEFVKRAVYTGIEFMYVPQGKSLDEYVKSLEYITHRDWITWIGLPRDALKFDGIHSREQLIYPSKILCRGKKIHLLGFSDDVMDDFMCCAHPEVIGIDSAVPIRAGQRGQPFQLSNSDYGLRGGYFHETKLTQQAVYNLKYVRYLLSNISATAMGV